MKRVFRLTLFCLLALALCVPQLSDSYRVRADDCCTKALEDAKKTCGSSGLKSFSCNATTCAFSFECKGELLD